MSMHSSLRVLKAHSARAHTGQARASRRKRRNRHLQLEALRQEAAALGISPYELACRRYCEEVVPAIRAQERIRLEFERFARERRSRWSDWY